MDGKTDRPDGWNIDQDLFWFTCSITKMPYVNCCLRNIGCKWWSKILKFWSLFRYGIKIATFGLGWQIGGGKYLPPAKLLMFSASSWVQVRGVLLRSIFIFPTRLCEHPLISFWFSTIVQALTHHWDNFSLIHTRCNYS